MKIRNIGLVVGVSALAMWGSACDAPTIDCRTLHSGGYIAKYTLVSGGPECSSIPGEVFGLQSYYRATSDRKDVNLDSSFLAIRPEEFGVIKDEADTFGDADTFQTEDLNSLGDFTGVDPNSDGICTVQDPTPAVVSINEIPANDEEEYPGRAATNISYTWKDVRVLVTPGAPGNLMEGELTRTQDGCTATFQVIAMWPIIGCEKLNEIIVDGEAQVEHTGEPNDDLCDDQPDLQAPYGIPVGSGINQDFVPKCDKDLLLCVATKTDLIPGGI